MKNLATLRISLLFIISLSIQSPAQEMTTEDLEKIFYVVSDSLRGERGNWQFMINGKIIACIADEKHNRMRIMSPIIEQSKLTSEDMAKLLEANYHTALDARYAISKNILWSIYIHPLHELSKDQVLNAIDQVYNAAATYGTTYTSSGLAFPKKAKEEEKVFEKQKM